MFRMTKVTRIVNREVRCSASAARRRRIVLSFSLALLLVSGCGDSRPPLAPITGTVTIDGQPLEQGTITFLPDSGRSAHGRIEAGAIRDVTTWEGGDGVQLGPVQVVIQSITNPDTIEADVEHRWLIPRRYGDPQRSGLTLTITPGMPPVELELISE